MTRRGRSQVRVMLGAPLDPHLAFIVRLQTPLPPDEAQRRGSFTVGCTVGCVVRAGHATALPLSLVGAGEPAALLVQRGLQSGDAVQGTMRGWVAGDNSLPSLAQVELRSPPLVAPVLSNELRRDREAFVRRLEWWWLETMRQVLPDGGVGVGWRVERMGEGLGRGTHLVILGGHETVRLEARQVAGRGGGARSVCLTLPAGRLALSGDVAIHLADAVRERRVWVAGALALHFDLEAAVLTLRGGRVVVSGEDREALVRALLGASLPSGVGWEERDPGAAARVRRAT